MPPWMISADSHKIRRKPGRVPITAPTTTTTTTTTTASTTPTSTTTTTARTTKEQRTMWTVRDNLPASSSEQSPPTIRSTNKQTFYLNENRLNKLDSPSVRVNSPVFNSQSDTFPTDFPSDHIKPKTGARIRDDFSQIAVNTMSDTASNTVTTESVIKTKIDPEITGEVCPDDVARNILWRRTLKGSMISTECPGKSSGIAIRECSDKGWERPQLSECKSNWMSDISVNYKNGVPVQLLSNDLKHKIDNFYLYGGDIIILFDLIESSIKNFQFKSSRSLDHSESKKNIQVLEDFSFVLSHLLEQKIMQVWMDLSPIEFEFLRTRYIALLQEVGMGVLESSIAETVVMSKNFGRFDLFQTNNQDHTKFLF